MEENDFYRAVPRKGIARLRQHSQLVQRLLSVIQDIISYVMAATSINRYDSGDPPEVAAWVVMRCPVPTAHTLSGMKMVFLPVLQPGWYSVWRICTAPCSHQQEEQGSSSQ